MNETLGIKKYIRLYNGLIYETEEPHYSLYVPITGPHIHIDTMQIFDRVWRDIRPSDYITIVDNCIDVIRVGDLIEYEENNFKMVTLLTLDFKENLKKYIADGTKPLVKTIWFASKEGPLMMKGINIK